VDHAIGKGSGKKQGEESGKGKTMDVETSWSEVVTALVVIVIIMFLVLTY
jgi:hypothetical protein